MTESREELVRSALVITGRESTFTEDDIAALCDQRATLPVHEEHGGWEEVINSMERISAGGDARAAFESSRLLRRIYTEGIGVPADPGLSESCRRRMLEITEEVIGRGLSIHDPENAWAQINRYALLRESVSGIELEDLIRPVTSTGKYRSSFETDEFDDYMDLRKTLLEVHRIFGTYHGAAEELRKGELVEADPDMADELDRVHMMDLEDGCKKGNSWCQRELMARYCEGDLVERD